MKNNGAVLIIVVLFTSSCLLCLAEGRATASNAFKVLNDYLVEQEKSGYFVKNIEAAKRFLDSSEPKKDPKAEELAELFVKIDTEDSCSANSIANLWAATKALQRYEPKMFEGATVVMRLSILMHDRINRAGRVCFKLLEEKWLADERKIHNYFEANLLTEHIEKADLVFLDANLKPKVLKYIWSFFSKHREDRPKKKHEELKQSMVEFYRKEYFEPCERLIDQEESKSILEPVGRLAELVDLSVLVNMKPIYGDQMLTFLWASRYGYCKTLLLQGIDSFVSAALHAAKKKDSVKDKNSED